MPVDSFEKLTDEYDAWLRDQRAAGHEVPEISADEALIEIIGDTTNTNRPAWLQDQINWLADFCDRWDRMSAG